MGFSFKIVHGKCMKTVALSIKAGQYSAERKKDCVIFHSWRVLNKPPTLLSPPSSMPENKEAPRGLNIAFMVITVGTDIKKWFIIRVQQRYGNMQTTLKQQDGTLRNFRE